MEAKENCKALSYREQRLELSFENCLRGSGGKRHSDRIFNYANTPSRSQGKVSLKCCSKEEIALCNNGKRCLCIMLSYFLFCSLESTFIVLWVSTGIVLCLKNVACYFEMCFFSFTSVACKRLGAEAWKDEGSLFMGDCESVWVVQSQALVMKEAQVQGGQYLGPLTPKTALSHGPLPAEASQRLCLPNSWMRSGEPKKDRAGKDIRGLLPRTHDTQIWKRVEIPGRAAGGFLVS